MESINKILQHYNPSDRQEIIWLINGFNEARDRFMIKDLGFLNPNLLVIVEQLKAHYPDLKVQVNGGYPGAIRKKVIIYPELYLDVEDNIGVFDIEYVNRFEQLEHRHVLGTLLNNGIQERMIGDIIVDEGGQIQVILDLELKENINYIITKIKNLSVRFQHSNAVTLVPAKKELKVLKVRSLRLDAVLKIFTKTSRNQATKLIKANKVKVNYSIISDLTHEVKESDEISIRGYGHYKITKINQVNNGYNIFFE